MVECLNQAKDYWQVLSHTKLSAIIQPTLQKVGLWNILVFPGFIVDAITGDMMKVPENQRNIDLKLCQK